jgi:hypothetical protein
MSLVSHILDHEKNGATNHSMKLGFCHMPDGYALMLDHDEAYFYWLRDDGATSEVSWDKWAIWRGAKKNRGNTAS